MIHEEHDPYKNDEQTVAELTFTQNQFCGCRSPKLRAVKSQIDISTVHSVNSNNLTMSSSSSSRTHARTQGRATGKRTTNEKGYWLAASSRPAVDLSRRTTPLCTHSANSRVILRKCLTSREERALLVSQIHMNSVSSQLRVRS